MFSLIVAIIAVLLTAGIAVATIYYGGTNVSTSSSRALAEQLVNAGEHITSAGALYQNDHAGTLPDTPSNGLTPYYLSALPLPPQAVYAKGAGTASTADWQYLPGTANVILPKLSTAACKAVNALYAIPSTPAALDPKYLIQCYGTAEPYTFFFDPPGGNMKQAAQVAAANASDPYYQKVALLMHMDNTLANAQNVSFAITGTAGAFGSGAFGTEGYQLSGGGGPRSTSVISGANVGSSPFTAEAWINFSDTSGVQGIFGNLNWYDASGWRLIWNGAGFEFMTNNSDIGSKAVSITPGTWHAVAVSSNGATAYIYLDGSLIGSGTYSPVKSGNNAFAIGLNPDQSSGITWPFKGTIDEVRVTAGVQRYAGSSYAVPTAAFPDH